MRNRKWQGLLVVFGLMLSLGFTKATTIDNVYMRYCDDEGVSSGITLKRTIMANVGERKEICFLFSNANQIPVRIKYGFANGILNKSNHQICEPDIISNTFSKNFTDPEYENRIFDLKAGESLKVKDTIMPPLGLSGLQMGCLVYYVDDSLNIQPGQMFAVLVRKAIPLNIFVGGNADIKNSIKLLKNKGGVYSTNSKVKAIVGKDNVLNVSFLVKNDGNISQDIRLSGRVSNFLGFEKEFGLQQKIIPGETKEVVVTVGLIPSYKGFFKIKYIFSNKPSFDVEIEGLDEKFKKGDVEIGSAHIYVFSWVIIIVIVVILFILWRAFGPRKRYINQQ